MKHVLVKDGKIENTIELEPGHFTQTFIEDDKGNKYPTETVGGKLKVTNKYLIPEGYEVLQSDKGDIGDEWPLVEEEV